MLSLLNTFKMREKRKENKVLSLYETCIKFVAININLVENLSLFPSLIGEEIFKYCLKLGRLDLNTDETVDSLRLFINAYGNDFISSVKCPNLIFLSEFEEPFEVLCVPLTKLDLTGCKIGNCSSLLSSFHEFKNLEVLILEGNELSDPGFRKMLLPMKVYKKGFESLKHLNVCKNTLTLYSISSILKLPKINELLITVPKALETYQQIMKSLQSQNFVENDIQCNKFSNITNEGWGAQIMSQWQNKLSEYELREKSLPCTTSALFYNFSTISPKFPPENFDISLNKFFIKNNESESPSEKCDPHNAGENESQPKKKITFQDIEAEIFDISLLNQYK